MPDALDYLREIASQGVGGGGGGSGDASAANQDEQTTELSAINTKLTTLISHVDGLEAAIAALPQNNVLLGGTFTDRSIVKSGAASEQIMAANANRRYAVIQNPSSAIESFFINYGAAAVVDSNSIEIRPGDVPFKAETTQAINVIGSNGLIIIAKELA